jgi:hypothetical protein
MPTLYMRLSAGCIWSVPHLIQREQEPYEELSLSLQNDSCVPVVGPGLLEPLWGSTRDVARELAEKLGFPLAPFRREDLPSVAQYVARRRTGRNSRMDALNFWLAAAENALKQKTPGLPAKLPGLEVQKPAQRLTSMLRAAAADRFKQPGDPFALLARLPASVYITTTPDPLLADALHAANRPPIVEYTRWTFRLEGKLYPRRYDENDKSALPTRDKPLVFHLFGTLEEPESIVLTEDDYFDYLIHIAKDANNTAIPSLVRTAYSQNALMVLGFDLDEWCFRALYRTIRSELGHGDQGGALSAAVQLNPEEDRHLRPTEALQYLEKMFGTENLNLSWAQPAEFLRQVWQRLPAAMGGPS